MSGAGPELPGSQAPDQPAEPSGAREYRIGDFSLVTRLSVKTLRYYHEIGLLEPSRIDADSAYRWYDQAAVRRAASIQLLKDLEFSLEEIKAILAEARDDADLAATVRAKMAELERRIAHYRSIRNQLAALINAEEGDPTMKQPNENAAWTTLPETRVASLRFTGRYDQVGPHFASLFRVYGRWAAGTPFCLYHDAEFRESDALIEACLPLRANAAAVGREGMEIRVLPAVRVAQILHRGGYDQLGPSYQRLFDFLAAERAVPAVPSREVYLKGPGMILPRSPRRFLTLIQVPVA